MKHSYIISEWTAVYLYLKLIKIADLNNSIENFERIKALIDKDTSTEPYSNPEINDLITYGKIKIANEKNSTSSNTKSINQQNSDDELNNKVYLPAITLKGKGKNFFYNMALDIDTNRPIILSVKDFNWISTKLKFNEAEKNYFNFFLNKEFDILKSIHQRNFENTNWSLYYFDETEDTRTPVSGISHAILHFGNYGRVSIDNKNKLGKDEKYIGIYKVDEDEKTILIQAKIEKSNQRDLHILFDIGEDDIPEIALGQYHNIGKELIYSGTVVMKQIEEKYESQAISIDKNISDENLINFFGEKYKNRMRTPRHIHTIDELNNWWNKKNAQIISPR